MFFSLKRIHRVALLLLVLLATCGAPGCRDQTPPPEAAAEQTVFVTKTGKKYHRTGCQYLHGEGIAQSLSAARKTLTPCAVCKP